MPLDSETVRATLVDTNEVQQGTLANPLFAEERASGTLTNGVEVAFAAAASSILAANANRKAVIIQNISAAAVARVGVAGVTAATGIQVVAGATVILEMPYCPVAELVASREGALSGTLLVNEIT